MQEYQLALDEERAWSEKLGQAARLQEKKAQAEKTLAREADKLRERIRGWSARHARKEQALVALRSDSSKISRETRPDPYPTRPVAQCEFPGSGKLEGQLEYSAQIAQELEHARVIFTIATQAHRTYRTQRQLKTLMEETRSGLMPWRRRKQVARYAGNP